MIYFFSGSLAHLMDKVCAGQCTFNLFVHETTATAVQDPV